MNKIFILLFFIFSVYADEIVIGDGPNIQEVIPDEPLSTDARLEEYFIDLRNRAGNHLIYDCRRNFFACVDEISKDSCIDRRGFQKIKKADKLECAFFKSYKNKVECVQEQYKMLEKKERDFCFKKRR